MQVIQYLYNKKEYIESNVLYYMKLNYIYSLIYK